MTLDDIDKKILEILQQDGRITNKDLAAQLNLSPPPTLERVKKLEKNGYIKRYAALVDELKININTVLMVSISLNRHKDDSIAQFREQIQDLEEVMECYHVTGDADYLLKVVCKDMNAYENFIVKKLSALEHIDKIKTSVVLSKVKHQTHYSLEHLP